MLIDAQEEAKVGGKIGIGSKVKEGRRLCRYDNQQLCPIMPVMPIISNSFLERRKRQLLNVWSGTKEAKESGRDQRAKKLMGIPSSHHLLQTLPHLGNLISSHQFFS